MTTKIRCIGPTGSPAQKVKLVRLNRYKAIANVTSRLERILSKTKNINLHGRKRNQIIKKRHKRYYR